ncbi:hypothetical protein [uncultured Kordia sp.]|uniref:hypothetical protein n=1 Tax=uncultured Kordia sp. TaxID=507699 RepID=UPI00262D8336|nr:hypothetical protein [uncultured Kordia sp.]
MSKFIICIILLFTFQTVIGQNNCGNFKSYEDYQNWIKGIGELKPEDRKIKIIQRIECEQKSEQNDIDFQLRILTDRYRFFNAHEIPIERNVIFKLVPANAYKIGYSLCKSDIDPSICDLGYVFIDKFEKLILNEIKQLKNIRVKRRKGKIILKIESEIESNIDMYVSGFLKKNCTRLIMEAKFKKGNNKIVIRRSNVLQYIELNLEGNKLLILI